jgi:hypothetical protein
MKGSSFLNEAFRAHLEKRLEGHRDEIEHFGSTLDGILDTAVVEFENKIKRRVDITKKNAPAEAIWIPGLRDNKAEGFKNNNILIKQ